MKIAALLLALLFCGCGSGCGAYTMSSSADGRSTRTVRLATVENRLFPPRPGHEYELTGRIKDEIATDRRLALTEGRADIILEVALTRFHEPNLVEDLQTGAPAEIQLQASVLIVARGESVPGGEVRRRVTRSQSYAPAVGDTREAGLYRLWRDLAREVVDVAADWEWAPRG